MSGTHEIQVRGARDFWCTPRYIIDALGPFDLDPCQSDPQPYACAREGYTSRGLDLPWHGRVWLNPPYGTAMSRWLARLADHGRGTALIFARTETQQFHTHVWPRASALLFLRGRVPFVMPGSCERSRATAPSVLVAYGANDAESLRCSGLAGALVTSWESARPAEDAPQLFGAAR